MKKFLVIVFLLISACGHLYQNNVEIKNAQNQTIYLEADGLQNMSYHKLAFVQHGLASNKEHQVVQTAKQAFIDNHYVVITFDSRYSLGESDNNVEKARLSTFEEDLKTVVDWAKTQPFYIEPFALSGHSLGGASVLSYAAKYPKQVNLLIPVSPVISGKLWEKSCMENMTDFCRQWQKKGTYEYTDPNNGKTATIPFNVVSDSFNYDASKLAHKISADTLLISAQNDIVIDPKDIAELAKHTTKKNIPAVIKDSGHNFNSEQNQKDLYRIIYEFVKNTSL